MRFLKTYWTSPLSILLAVTLLAAASSAGAVGQARPTGAAPTIAATERSSTVEVASSLSPGRETVAIGGMSKGTCDFAAGVSVGLGIAGIFGCVVCAGVSLAISGVGLLVC